MQTLVTNGSYCSISGHRRPLVPIGSTYFKGSVAIGPIWNWSHCGTVLYASLSKVHILTDSHKKAFLFGPWVPWSAGFHPMTPDPRVHGPTRGWRSKSRASFKSVSSTFLLWKQLWQIVGRTSVSLVTLTNGSRNEDHHDLYFTVKWFCLISSRLFNVWTSYFGIMCQYALMFDLKINIGHYDLYFMVQWFCLISWRLFDIWTS